MIKSKGRRITWFVLTLILAMGMIGSSVAFAAPNDADDTASRMTTSSNVGKITWFKTFTRVGTTWPDKKSFDYTIEKVKFWDNSNVSTSANGEEKTTANPKDAPMPLPGMTVAQAAGKLSAKVNVPVYTSENTQFKAAENTATGSIVSQFAFERPGYYVYKVHEDNDGVAGVTYDDHTYYLCFYVANKTEDNTSTGVTEGGKYADNNENSSVDYANNIYVHTITAWRTQVESNSTDIQGLFEDHVVPAELDPAWENEDHYFIKVKFTGEEGAEKSSYNKATLASEKTSTTSKYFSDKDGKNAVANADLQKDTVYWLEVTEDQMNDYVVEIGEVGKTNRSGSGKPGEPKPDELTVKFWNETDSKDIEVKKIVTGTLGDVNKEFVFTINLANLQKGSKIEVESTTADLTKHTGLTAESGKYYVVVGDNATTAEFTVKMKSKESIKIKGLPTGATYTVTETASDHKPSYKITAGDDAVINAANQNVVNNVDQGIAGTKDTALAMAAAETVDPTDGAVVITYTNHRDIETETGIPGYVFPIVLAAMIALIGLAAMRRKNNVSSVNDFEF